MFRPTDKQLYPKHKMRALIAVDVKVEADSIIEHDRGLIQVFVDTRADEIVVANFTLDIKARSWSYAVLTVDGLNRAFCRAIDGYEVLKPEDDKRVGSRGSLDVLESADAKLSNAFDRIKLAAAFDSFAHSVVTLTGIDVRQSFYYPQFDTPQTDDAKTQARWESFGKYVRYEDRKWSV
jgi:hypothetical protein